MSHFEQYYIDPQDVSSDAFRLGGAEFNHAVRVKRNRIGDRIVATDGLGKRYAGKIVSIDSREVVVKIDTIHENRKEPSLRLTLAQAVPKAALFEWVLEKGTEIGICRFIPMRCQYSVKVPFERKERWRKKVISAVKQSGRSFCPPVDEIQPLDAVLKSHPAQSIFIAHPEGDSVPTIKTQRVLLLVGPEGGFSQQELDLAGRHGARLLHLGQRRLRSETAALVAASKILISAGEL